MDVERTNFVTTRIPIRLKTPGSKMRNVRVQVDGIWFDSNKEANRWSELCILQASEHITNLRRQVWYDLWVGRELICRYRADFVYTNLGSFINDIIVEDVKGRRTREYIIKKKLMKACLGIEIVEV